MSFQPDQNFLPVPSDCGLAARELRNAIARFTSLGMKVPLVSRLQKEAQALENTAAADAFPSGRSARQLVANGMVDAEEFAAVSRMLPDSASREYLLQLQAALHGDPDRDRVGQQAFRYQSQFWVTAMLHAAGLKPRVVDGGGPDCLVTIGTLDYGVEIKRPETAPSARGLLKKAARQLLDYGVPGVVMIDLRECLTLPESLTPETRSQAVEQFLARASMIRASLRDVARDPVRMQWRAGFQNLWGIVYFSRAWCWLEAQSPGLVLATTSGESILHQGRAKTLRFHHASILVGALRNGLAETGTEFPPQPGPKWV